MYKPPTSTNHKLAVLIKKGDEAALSELFDSYYQKLYQSSFKLLKTKDLADEVVQQAFIKLWENRDKIDTSRSIKGYLFIIAKNLIFDNLRNISRNEELKEIIASRIPLYHNMPEDSLIYANLKELAEKAIERLPAQRQLIFKLSREEGLTHEEIAQRLGIAKNTVKFQIVKSLKYIKETLSADLDISFSLLFCYYLIYFQN